MGLRNSPIGRSGSSARISAQAETARAAARQEEREQPRYNRRYQQDDAPVVQLWAGDRPDGRHAEEEDEQGDGAEGQVDVEDPAPVDVVRQGAADERAENAGRGEG